MNSKPTLYLDMDGVLADFNTAARQLIGASRSDQTAAEQNGRWPAREWRRIADQTHFYRNLPKMPQADELVEIALKFRDHLGYSIKILSAVPSGNDMFAAFHDKIDWINEHYGEHNFRVEFGPYSHDKHLHCKSSQDILVDDRTSNCQDWQRAGGTAIQVNPGQYRQAMIDLELLFRNLLIVSSGTTV